jgi:hypothetical protein
MGYGAWDSTSYSATSSVRSSMTREQVYTQHETAKEFEPKLIEKRESLDSPESPESTAIIVGLDVTGSMGFIPEYLAKKGLGKLVQGILDAKPVSDPHMLFMAIGDINWDDAPLQITQFEADNRISDQIVDLYLEGGGGGNRFESYDLAWIFAANKTTIDCWDKRQKKGYLFTIGDEEFPRSAGAKVLNKQLDLNVPQDATAEQHLANAQERYNVFHLIVEEGYHCQHSLDTVVRVWTEALGKHAIRVNNYKHIPEIIISVMRVNEGENPQEVLASWQDEEVSASVKYSLFNQE